MDVVSAGNARIPAIGLGTWELQGAAAIKAVTSAIELGYRHIDTAEMYGNETEVGQGIKAAGIPRTDIFLTTKIWSDNIADGKLQQHARASLQRLGVEYVDLLLIHWPNARIPLKDSIKALREVQRPAPPRISAFPISRPT